MRETKAKHFMSSGSMHVTFQRKNNNKAEKLIASPTYVELFYENEVRLLHFFR